MLTALLLSVLPAVPSSPTDVVFIHDAGKDLDDEAAALTLATLQRAGYVNVVLTVAGVAPALERAQLVRGLFGKAGLDIASAVGDESGTAESPRAYQNTTYMAPASEIIGDGIGALAELIAAAAENSRPLAIVVTSALTELAQAIQRIGEDVADRGISQIAFMGGIAMNGADPVIENGAVLPEGGAKGVQNVIYDEASAIYVYAWAQRRNIPFTITTRWAAGGSPISSATYAAINDPDVSTGMNVRAYEALVVLWGNANLPLNSDERRARNFPLDRCDRAWYVNTFLKGIDPGEQDILTVLMGNGPAPLNPYDAQAALAILDVPEVFSRTQVGGASVIGLSKESNGIVDKARTTQVFHDLIVGAIIPA